MDGQKARIHASLRRFERHSNSVFMDVPPLFLVYFHIISIRNPRIISERKIYSTVLCTFPVPRNQVYHYYHIGGITINVTTRATTIFQ